MEATYFNFSNVIAIVADRIVDTLSQCKKLQEFRDKCSGSKNAEKGNNKKSKDKKDKKKTTPFFKKLGGVMSPKPNEKNVSNKKTESIHTVVKEGNTKKASDLIREGTNINELNESGQSALHVAVINGNLDMVRLLLWKDAEVDIKNPAGWTPLHEAAKNSSLEICDVLLHKGANPSAETSDGITPFHYLVGRRFVDNNLHQEVMTDMLNKGININHSNNSNSETPLFYAVAKGLTDVARFLIAHGADPNVKNRRGYTVLHIAIMQGEKAMVEVLLQSGADVTIPAKEGTPAELAKSSPQVLETINSYINNKGKPQNPAQQVATKAVNKPLPIPGKKVLPPLPANHPRARPASTKLPEKGSNNGNQVSCFHGDISREQAEALVVAQNKDCFLLRTSSVRGCYAMTVYKPGALELTHFLVYPRSTGGFSIQDCDDTNSYPNLNELITKSPVLKGCFPIPSPKPQPTQQQVPTKAFVAPSPGGESIYGMAPPSNELLKNQMNDLQKLLEASLIDVEKPAEWNKTKVNLKKALNGLAGLLN